MSQKSKIEWTESSWNPVTGCTKISAGCSNCYAATFAKRLKAMGNKRYINQFDVTIHEDLIERPLSWKKPQMIFVNSMSDLFHESIPDEIVKAIFNTMNKASWHTFQVLTKRAERLVELSPQLVWTQNIWMGVSVEDAQSITRCQLLKQTPAMIKFVSAEPLIERLESINLNGIHWLIVGGESGHRCRPMDKAWALELRDKAIESNTAFFFKQWGGVHKAKNGSLLDGLEYKEYPIL